MGLQGQMRGGGEAGGGGGGRRGLVKGFYTRKSERVDEINISIALYHMYMHVCVLGCRHKMSARGSLLSRYSEGVEPATAWRNCELDWTSG